MGFLDKQLNSSLNLIFENVDLSHAGIVERGKYLHYVPQSFDLTLVSSTVKDEVAYSLKKKKAKNREQRARELLQLFSLEQVSERDPLTLSMGQRRRVAMASALASGARVIMLDEPTSGQDFYHRESLGVELAKLKSLGYSFLVVTHDSRFVYRHADRMAVLDKGVKVLEGKPEEVFEFSENYGIPPPTDFLLRRE
jgi:energy-coupling factor transport system ATP-binding protein